jgi:hypothetical protein
MSQTTAAILLDQIPIKIVLHLYIYIYIYIYIQWLKFNWLFRGKCIYKIIVYAVKMEMENESGSLEIPHRTD